MITNEQRDDLLQYYDATGILKKEIRSYEVSLWTLQDEFITVLKWSDAEHKGRIENPTMTLNVDGTQNFECNIPMYIDYKGKIIENPNWYHTQNENIIMDLRKIKVILNKGTDNEAVFEFIIVEVTESHENSILTCNIKCEGLAFHELGKIGYKINLSEDTFYDAYEEWENEENRLAADEPVENIDFWMGEKGLKLEKAQANQNPTKWYYKVDMNWASFKDGSLRDRSKIYEEPYASDWDEDLKPIATENYKEKQRPISIENSNIYNITQTIAETFQVYCRYEYGYDENYHINSRTIIFYNNFLCEDNPLSLTYPYSSTKVSRTMDSNDLTTKLYVLSVENANNLDGFNSIMNAKANKTKEDYILNFDYLYKTNGITEEQYKRINEFEIEIRDKNKELVPLQNIYNKLSTEKVEIEGKKTFYENSVTAAQEQITTNSALINNLVSTHGDGYSVEKDEKNPDYLPVQEGEDGKSVNLTYTNKGIKSESIEIYTSYNSINSTLSNEITDFIIIFDEYNCPAEIRFKTLPANTSMVYLTYEYVPQLYYDSVVKVWEDKMAQDSIQKDLYTAKLTSITQQIENVKSDIDTKIKEKEELIADFEHMMGPALREGYWQPEDYKDYGSKYNVPKDFNGSSTVDAVDENDYALIWDDKLFDTEQDISYKQGVDLDVKYYPCINLNTVFSNNIPSNIDEYSFIFNNTFTKPTQSNALIKSPVNYIRTFKIDKNGGGEAVLCYIKNSSNVIIPCLLLVGAKTMTDGTIDQNNNEIAYMKNSQLGHPTIGTYTATVDDETKAINVVINNEHSVGAGAWITLDDTYKMVYPRIQFISSNYEGNNTQVYYQGQKLERYEDYQPLTRLNDSGVLESLITIKPKIMYAAQNYNGHVEVHYTISNANTQIYLDAIAVSKENAWPKVSYEVTPSIMNKDIVRTLYKHLAQLVMINDAQLKFTNTFGYISGMTLDLDNPQNDTLEIKNYKTKFEDLFSNIVAQTEAMKTNEGRFYAAMEGEIPLSSDALSSVLNINVQTFDIMQEYLDSYFDSSQVVQDRLTKLFTEAGEILTDAGQALSRVRSLTTENASILAGFAQNIAGELTVKVTKSEEKPQGFKVGDIWIQTDASGNEVARYVATYNASEMEGNTNNPSSGFVRTYDGTLSSITGAGMTIDTVQGLVDIYGAHEINLRSGEHVYIGAGDTVDIVGNESVNIGGTTINLCTLTDNNNVAHAASGINLIAAAMTTANLQNANISKVLITPQKIEMGAAELELKAASTISMIASTGAAANTSTIQLDADKGIWIGSGQTITLFSGSNNNGANIKLSPTQLLLGYSNISNGSGAAIEMTDSFVIIATGGVLTGNLDTDSAKTITGASNGLIGAKFTNQSIGLAVQTGSGNNAVTTALLMDENGFTVGSGGIDITSSDLRTGSNSNINNGSYTRISKEGIELGSFADLYINTNNFKLQTHSRDKNVSGSSFIDGETIMAIGNNLQNVDYYTMIYDTGNNAWKKKNADGTLSNITFTNGAPTVRLLVNKNGLYVNGTVYANAGSFTGDITATSFLLSGNTATTNFNSAVSATATVSTINTNIANTINISERIYYLSASTTAPSAPNTRITLDYTSSVDTWALTYPTYPDDGEDYYYYSCLQKTTNGNVTTWTTPTREYGITSAAVTAVNITNNISPITTYGMIGYNSANAGQTVNGITYDSNGYPTQFSPAVSYGLILGNNKTYPLLIGSNGGIHIINTQGNGAAVIIDQSGIALTGATISLNAQSSISITSGGNFRLDAGGVMIDTGAGSGNVFSISGTNGSLTFTKTGDLSVTGTVTSSNFVATATGGSFRANGSTFGLYNADGTSGILTFSVVDNVSYMNVASTYKIKAEGGLTIALNQHFVLDTPTCKLNSNAASGTAMLYIADDSSWDSATSGMRFIVGTGIGTGLQVKGSGVFSGDMISGGTISGVSLAIGPDANNPLLSFNSNTNVLSFNGIVTATSGTIGPWTINGTNNRLEATIGNKVAVVAPGELSIAEGVASGTHSLDPIQNAPIRIGCLTANESGVHVVGTLKVKDLYVESIYPLWGQDSYLTLDYLVSMLQDSSTDVYQEIVTIVTNTINGTSTSENSSPSDTPSDSPNPEP